MSAIVSQRLCRLTVVVTIIALLAPASAAPDQPQQAIQAIAKEIGSTWETTFARLGKRFDLAKVIVFSDTVETSCGRGRSNYGPFYCPLDRTIYLSETFPTVLSERFNSPGDAALSYVVAHEYGHHVQNLLGVMERKRQVQALLSSGDASSLEVRVELQADCLAGMAMREGSNGGRITADQIAQAIATAKHVGDDALLQNDSWNMMADSFSHGSALQRERWFREGIDAAELAACDTVDWATVGRTRKPLFEAESPDLADPP